MMILKINTKSKRKVVKNPMFSTLILMVIKSAINTRHVFGRYTSKFKNWSVQKVQSRFLPSRYLSQRTRRNSVVVVLALTIVSSIVIEILGQVNFVFAHDLNDYNHLIGDPRSHLTDIIRLNQQTLDFEYNHGYSPAYQTTGDSSSPKFSATFYNNSSNGIDVTDVINDTTLNIKPLFRVANPKQDENRIYYPLIGKDGLKVITLGTVGYKEDLIFNSSPGDELTLKYELTLPSGTIARLENNGNIGIYGVDSAFLGQVSTGSETDAALLEKVRQNAEKDYLLFTIPAPLVVEGNGSYDLPSWYSIEENIIAIHVIGLNDATYPLSIDPSIYVETASKLMQGNNESNIDFDINNELIQKGFTTGARYDTWSETMDMNNGRWNQGTAVAGGFVYAVGGEVGNTTTTIYSTAGSDTYAVPAGVSEVTIKMWGAGAGGGGGGIKGVGGDGGGGGYARANITVTPLESLDIYVGAKGVKGDFSTGPTEDKAGDGGGGGGRSYVERSGTPLIIAAGGGAGGGGSGKNEFIAGGGGGAGGGATGEGGSASSAAPGGNGGTQSAGGAGGDGTDTNDGVTGASETGGDGADGADNDSCTDGSMTNGGNPNGGDGGTGDECKKDRAGGGGGGDGYYGGGGGASTDKNDGYGGGGGGGGSSYTTGTATSKISGSGTVPGNDTDSDRGTAGNGGTGGALSTSGTDGNPGKVVISYNSGGSAPSKTVYWAKLSTTDNSIISPNPGAGVCTEWCTNSSYDLPDERIGFSLVAYNGFLYAIGGEDDLGVRVNTVYISKLGANGEPALWHPTDNNKDNWVYWYASTNTLTNATSYAAAVAYKNQLYYLGGQTNASSGGVTAVYSATFDPTGDIEAWTTTGMTVLPSVRNGHSVHVYNDYMYFIGGDSNGTMQNNVHYNKLDNDGSMNTWQSTESFATARTSWGGNYSVIWGGYIYLSGGCSVVNGSGYCTTIENDVQLASINADGTLGKFDTIDNVTNHRIGYGFLAWDGALYRVGGCEDQDGASGDCISPINDEDYAVINQDGDASTVSISTASGTGNCTGGSPYDCDLPPAGDDYAEGGHMLSAVAVVNGYIYVIGGCTDYDCKGNDPAEQDVSGNVSYAVINTDGTLTKPSNCIDEYYGSWCVDSTHKVNDITGTAASGVAVLAGYVYLVGGLTGTGNVHGNLFSNSFNSDGSLNGAWVTQDLTDLGITEDIAYAYAYARANPASAGTYPGNLFVFGGCGDLDKVDCKNTDYETEVYKCNIKTDGTLEESDADDCTTTGQLQIDSDPGTGGAQGLGTHAGTVYANYIYLIGGNSQTESDKDTVLYAKFDDSNNVVAVTASDWVENTTTLSTGRQRGAAFGYNGYLYAVGGFDNGGGSIIDDIEFAKIDVSDGSVGSFVVSDITIDQRWGLSIGISNSYAYVFGGCDVGGAPNSCTSFDPSVQTFAIYNNDSGAAVSYSAGANLFATDRVGASSAIYNGYIYVAGGCTSTTDCTNATNSVQYAALDAYGAVGTWSATTTNLPADRTWGKLEVAGGTLYYIGGQDDTATNEQSTVYYGTPSSGDVSTWDTASNGLPAARTQFSTASWNDRLYVTGGLDGSANESNTVYISPQQSSGGNITSAWTSDSDTFDVARSGHTTIAYANNLYVFGGHDGTNYLSDSQFTQINSDGTVDAWTFTTSLPESIRQGDGFAANGYLYIIGGRTSDNLCLSNTLVVPISANTTIATGNNPTGVGEWYQTNISYSGNRYGNSVSYNQGKVYILGGACNSINTNTTTYSTAGSSTYSVPAGVTSIVVEAWGGDGGGGAGGKKAVGGGGGEGGYAKVTITVTPLESLNTYVGGGGVKGTHQTDTGSGGGGGGHSEVDRSGTSLIIAGGGGGGGGGDDNDGQAGGAGGAGGGTTGNAGSDARGVALGGDGGTQSAGGAGGTGGGNSGSTGGSESGGDGADGRHAEGADGGENNGGIATGGDGGLGEVDTSCPGGGGGGSGFYGGGGGSAGADGGDCAGGGDSSGAGGGGGSGYVTGTSTVMENGGGVGGSGGAIDTDGIDGSAGLIKISYDDAPVFTYTGANRVVQTSLLAQPQVAKYSRMIDTDTDVFPTKFLLNGVDNSIGARWQTKYTSSTAANSEWGQETNFGDTMLGVLNTYTPLDDVGSDTEFARFYYFWLQIDATHTYGYPEDVERGPTIADLTLFFTSDPGKRLRHGKTFTGGLKQPLDTPPP